MAQLRALRTLLVEHEARGRRGPARRPRQERHGGVDHRDRLRRARDRPHAAPPARVDRAAAGPGAALAGPRPGQGGARAARRRPRHRAVELPRAAVPRPAGRARWPPATPSSLKPSEVAPATSRAARAPAPALPRRGRRCTSSRAAVPETTALLAERFDHIFYTGNGAVGTDRPRGRGPAPDAGDARAGRQVAGLRRRRRRPRGDRAAARLGQVHQRRPDVRGARLRPREPPDARGAQTPSRASDPRGVR